MVNANRKAYSVFIMPALAVLFLLFTQFTTGIRSDHIFLLSLIVVCYYASMKTRRWITALGIIIVYWIIYDSMKAWPNWAYNAVDIEPLYLLEKSIFGIRSGASILTPNEYLELHTSVAADIICGIFYLGWVPLPLLFAFYLYSVNKNIFLRFCMAFFIVNIIGFIIYYLYPAAPPWYYAAHGSVLHTSTPSNAAGLLRFDQYFGIELFSGLYSKGSNVFAAMPSLHSSYPVIGLAYALKQPARWITILFLTFMVGIWISAVYLNHHYILDVLAGIVCGLLGIFLLEKILMKNKYFSAFMKRYELTISWNKPEVN